jgi:hypothetical protein
LSQVGFILSGRALFGLATFVPLILLIDSFYVEWRHILTIIQEVNLVDEVSCSNCSHSSRIHFRRGRLRRQVISAGFVAANRRFRFWLFTAASTLLSNFIQFIDQQSFI